MIPLPDCVEVYGYIVPVKLEELADDTWGEASGWESNKPVIKLASKLIKEDWVFQWQVLAHEISHVVLGLAGIDVILGDQADEQICRVVAEQVWRALAEPIERELVRPRGARGRKLGKPSFTQKSSTKTPRRQARSSK